MYSFDEIEEAQDKALEYFRNSPYYTPDNVQMYKAVFGVMNANLPKATREDSLNRVDANRMADEPAEPMKEDHCDVCRDLTFNEKAIRRYGSFGTGS